MNGINTRRGKRLRNNRRNHENGRGAIQEHADNKQQYIDEKNSECELEVDGGINQQTAEIAKKNGANVLVLGSAFFGAADRLSLAASVKADCR